jgi:hypothetical protein
MPKKLMICLPAFGRVVSAETTASLVRLSGALAMQGIEPVFTTHSYPDIAELRNQMLTLWYDCVPDAKHCLMVDADMGFEPQLVLEMLDWNQQLVGCLYPKKTYPISYVGRLLEEPKEAHDGFLEVQAIGFGITLIRRDCVEAMLAHETAVSDPRIDAFTYGPMLRQWGVSRLIRAFDEIETDQGRMTEDYSFCKRHRDCGGKVYAATHHRITHVGPHGYSGCFAEAAQTRPAPYSYQWTA